MNNEDVKILEELKNKKYYFSSCQWYNGYFELDKEEKQAIEHLIARIKELEDKCIELSTTIDALKTDNKELEVENLEKEYWKSQYFNQVKYGNRITLQGDSISNVIDIMKKDYIPKSKVREILEKIKGHNYKCNFDDVNFLQNIIIEIQELLGEED